MWQNALPLYKQIANKIKEDITLANLSKGDAIPTETKLAKDYGVSRVTVRQAIKMLVDEGLVYRVQGSGTYIRHEKIEHNIFKLQGFTEEMSQLDHHPENTILEFSLTTPSNEIREILNLSEGEKTYYVKRLRLADKEPLVLEESYLPVKLFPDLSVHVMEKSKYEYIEKKGYKIDKRYGEIIPIMPTEELVEYLNVSRDDPLLFLRAYSTLQNQVVFEYSKVYFHPRKYTFKLESSKR